MDVLHIGQHPGQHLDVLALAGHVVEVGNHPEVGEPLPQQLLHMCQ